MVDMLTLHNKSELACLVWCKRILNWIQNCIFSRLGVCSTRFLCKKLVILPSDSVLNSEHTGKGLYHSCWWSRDLYFGLIVKKSISKWHIPFNSRASSPRDKWCNSRFSVLTTNFQILRELILNNCTKMAKSHHPT